MSDADDWPTSLGGFLRSRRARLTPAQVGLTSYGTRRVPGLRREELAQLAGVSPTYYTRLEKDQAAGVSDSVIDAIARALDLDEDERVHLHALARPARPPRATNPVAPDAMSRLVHAMADVPAVLLDRRGDVCAWNRPGWFLLAGHLPYRAPEQPGGRPNLTRLLFLDERTRSLYPDWQEEALRAVASLRLMAGRYPQDRRLARLVGELALKSEQFVALWSQHPVRNCYSGLKRFHHRQAGELELEFSVLQVPDDSGQRIMTYHASPRSSSDAALRLLTAASLTFDDLTEPAGTTPPQGGWHEKTQPSGNWHEKTQPSGNWHGPDSERVG